MELIKVYDVLNKYLIQDISKIVMESLYQDHHFASDNYILVPKDAYQLTLKHSNEIYDYMHIYETFDDAVGGVVGDIIDYWNRGYTYDMRYHIEGQLSHGYFKVEDNGNVCGGGLYNLEKIDIRSIIKI